MANWKIQLAGDIPAWTNLPTLFGSEVCRITANNGEHCLTSSKFNVLDDVEQVRLLAQRLLIQITSILSLHDRDIIAPTIGAVIRINDDGTQVRTVTLQARASIALARASGELTVLDEHGNLRPAAQSEQARWLEVAQHDEAADKALRLIAQGDTWDNLYRLYEVVEGDLMQHNNISDDPRAPGVVMQSMQDRGWASAEQIRLFRGVANSPSKIGDAARHGHEPRKTTPEGSMTLAEAHELVWHILTAWIRSKN